MKNNSKKRQGFTLVEVIISMALIGILSVAIYNGYLLIIRQTKGGEVKQQSSLIGKQITEEIKSVYNEKEFMEENGVVKLGNISLISEGENSKNYSSNVKFDKNGQVINTDDSQEDTEKYEVKIGMRPKITNEDSEGVNQGSCVEIKDFENDLQGETVYVIKSGSEIELSDQKEKSEDIAADLTLALAIDIDKDSINIRAKCGQQEATYKKAVDLSKEKNRLNLDLKYCKGNIHLEVSNSTTNPLNLYILNSNNDRVDVVNKKGVLNEYYRSENTGRVGLLYDIDIKVYDKNDDKTILYEGNFVQNVDIK